VVGVGRRPEPLAGTGALIARAGGRFVARPANVRDPAAIAALVTEVGRGYGLQILVNNAGGQFVAPVQEISARGWASVLDLNLTAVATITEAAYPWLAQRGGTVVNLSLSEPERGIAGLAHSAAARAGVLGLTRALAAAWWDDDIRVTCVAPGTVLTDGVRGELSPHALADLVAGAPLGRDTGPEEVAALVAFLTTPAGGLLSGQLLHLDGGASLPPPPPLTSPPRTGVR
jgi:citronellol/citronellal dehydrogenase